MSQDAPTPPPAPAAAPHPEPENRKDHARQAGSAPEEAPISEDEVRQRLVGKTLYLRGGYSDNSLHFDVAGRLLSTSPKDSYTMSLIEIEKVRVEKRKVELIGIRYGLHFLSNPTADDPLSVADKVRITPKKKVVTITIWREGVFSKKDQKEKRNKKGSGGLALPAAAQQPASQETTASTATTPLAGSQAESNQALRTALDNIFATSLDDRMISSMPACWQLYFRAAAAQSDYRPADPAILRQSAVDQKAHLLTSFVPPSNELAEKAGIVGAGIYHVVVSAGGTVSQVVISHPVGFGLDENAVASIQKVSFQPAIKNGQPVPVLLDLVVEYRIFSKRTGTPSEAARVDVAPPNSAPLPGPYSVNQPVAKPQ